MSTQSKIKCPHCESEIDVSEAMSHHLRAQITAENNTKLEADRLQIAADAEKSAATKVEARVNELESQAEEQATKLKEAGEKELSLLKEKSDLEDSQQNFDLAVARETDGQRQKIVSDTLEQAGEAERLKELETGQVIGGLKKQVSELKQSVEQGSMQLQGETLEVQLEEELRAAFCHDEITEIKKGQQGADARQVVRTNQGVDCGKILWEAKRAKNWSKSWVEKLKKDQREAGAELAVLVTTSPPNGLRGFDQYEGIWVCEPLFAVATAKVLRHCLIETAMQRAQVSCRKDKMALLYDYLCSVDFRQNINGLVETFILQQKQLDAERRSFQKQWRERQKQLNNGIECTVSIYGDIQGIAGREAIPEIKTLELPGG